MAFGLATVMLNIVEAIHQQSVAESFCPLLEITCGYKALLSANVSPTRFVLREKMPSERQFKAAIFTEELLLPFHFHDSRVSATISMHDILGK